MKVKLVLFREDNVRREFTLESGTTVIGRQDDCTLRIPLAEISRRHAVIEFKNDKISIKDMGSANGTYVNNQRVSEQELNAGDHVVVGPVVFTVQVDGEPADIRPVRTRLKARPLARETAVPVENRKSDQQEPEDQDFLNDEEDPISELEALASTGDTEAFDLDLDLDLGLSDSFPAESDDDQKS